MGREFNVKSFAVDVASAGTAVPLTASGIWTPEVTLQALAGNTNGILIGGSDVAAANGHELDPGEKLTLRAPAFDGTTGRIHLDEVYVDADANGNDVIVTYLDAESA